MEPDVFDSLSRVEVNTKLTMGSLLRNLYTALAFFANARLSYPSMNYLERHAECYLTARKQNELNCELATGTSALHQFLEIIKNLEDRLRLYLRNTALQIVRLIRTVAKGGLITTDDIKTLNEKLNKLQFEIPFTAEVFNRDTLYFAQLKYRAVATACHNAHQSFGEFMERMNLLTAPPSITTPTQESLVLLENRYTAELQLIYKVAGALYNEYNTYRDGVIRHYMKTYRLVSEITNLHRLKGAAVPYLGNCVSWCVGNEDRFPETTDDPVLNTDSMNNFIESAIQFGKLKQVEPNPL